MFIISYMNRGDLIEAQLIKKESRDIGWKLLQDIIRWASSSKDDYHQHLVRIAMDSFV